MDPTAIPAFALPLNLDESVPCVCCVMFGRTVGVANAGMIALPGFELALVDVAFVVDEVAGANRGAFLASVVSVSH